MGDAPPIYTAIDFTRRMPTGKYFFTGKLCKELFFR